MEVNRKYMDGVFRMLFNDKKEALALYNAINGTDYSDTTQIDINTLENAIYLGIKNDLSFIMASMLNLYEQQSTLNPNMPLRDLFYVADLLQKITQYCNIFGSKLIKIPAPAFIVLYNGAKVAPERTEMKLSDAYEVSVNDPALELKCTMLNINSGKNVQLLEKCSTLKEYMVYIDTVRKYSRYMKLEDAVATVVDECINNNILREFLLSQKSEVVKMSIYEYDYEKHMAFIRLEGIEEGIEKGIEVLIADNIEENIPKERTIEKLKKNFEISEEKAIEYYNMYGKI